MQNEITYITAENLNNPSWFDKHYNELGEIKDHLNNTDGYQIAIRNDLSDTAKARWINNLIDNNGWIR